jgi:hypothetical protein
MPVNNAIRALSVFFGGTGNPDTLSVPLLSPTATPGSYTPYAPGEVGASIEYQDRTYTDVYLDSGATSATPTGAVLSGQIAYWKDKANRWVTNDARFAFNPTNSNFCVAGIFRANQNPGTYGSQIFILCRGYSITLLGQQGVAAGVNLQANTSSGVNNATTYSTGQVIGFSRTPTVATGSANGTITADIDISTLP